MTTRFALPTALLLAILGCAQYISTAPDLTTAADIELQRHVGQSVTLSGPFSLRGKVGPFILVGGRPVFLVSRGGGSWGEQFERMEGHHVRVTGTLRFAHYAEVMRDGLPAGSPSDHYFFEAASAKIELSAR